MWHAPVCESFDLGARQRCSRVATFLALQLAVQVKAGGHAEAVLEGCFKAAATEAAHSVRLQEGRNT